MELKSLVLKQLTSGSNTQPRNRMISWFPEGGPNELLYAAAAKSLQSCPTLCDPIDGSPSGSPTLSKGLLLE